MRTVKEIAEEHFYEVDELPKAFEMVADIMELAAESLEANEPHAVVSIRELTEMSREIRDFDGFCEGNYLKVA